MRTIINPVIFIKVALIGVLISTQINLHALDFPDAGWHRGDVSVAQENSRKAILAAFESDVINLEVDVCDFIDEQGHRVGILAHECNMERTTDNEGLFIDHHSFSKLPKIIIDSTLQPEPFMSVLEFFDLIEEVKKKGTTPIVSLDLKEEGETAQKFGVWLGHQIQKRQFVDHVFASSPFREPLIGIKSACVKCLVGGLVFDHHWVMMFLSHHNSTLDISTLGKILFFLGFPFKNEFSHDFVLIHDDVLFSNPDLPDYWRKTRNVKFVGVYVYEKNRPYTKEEWEKLSKADWLELDPPQMSQKLDKFKTENRLRAKIKSR